MSDQFHELHLAANPIHAFENWLKDAKDELCAEPTAMTLATASKSGVPSARIVLFKGLKDEKFKFFTNYESPKAHDLIENPIATLVFLWTSPKFQRQIRVFGQVEKLSPKESEEYFHTRARGSQIGAWSSPQSQKVESRLALERRLHETEKKFDSQMVPLPSFWGGFALSPQSLEFWEGRQYRIHERFIFERSGDSWVKSRLAP